MMEPAYLRRESEGAWLIDIKAVPGAGRDEIAGLLGDRLKIRIAAPPEGGRANKAIRAFIAKHLGCRARDVEIVAGETSPEKTLRVRNIDAKAIERLA